VCQVMHGFHSQANITFQDFFGQNYHFPGQRIQDLKVINQDMCEKAYHIYSIYDRLLRFV